MARTERRRWRAGALVATLAMLAACAGAGEASPTVGTSTAAAASSAPPRSAAPTTTSAGAPDATADSTVATTRDSTPRAGDAADPDGIGDELFPGLGNPGVDVQHYDVDLTYDHEPNALHGTVGLDIRFTEDRDEFTLDSDGPVVDAVTIDAAPVAFRQDGAELRITPVAPLRAGDTRRVEVTYHADPGNQTGADGVPDGWFRTDGGSYVLNEPDGAHRWLPSNDHPSDKATYDFTIHTAPGVTGVANGALVDHTTSPAGETWRWREDQPMATYLIQLLTGDYELVEGTGPHGLPLLSAVLRSELPAARAALDAIPGQLADLEAVLGPYPLDRYGIAVTDSFSGLAMETQGRSQYSKDDLGMFANDGTFLHELAHQWYGDAVTPARWQDIWLNEGFATYAPFLATEHAGGIPSVPAVIVPGTDGPPSFDPIEAYGPIGAPTAATMFGAGSYNGGSAVLTALRQTIGDDEFFELLRRWVADNNGTSRTSQDFIALAEEVSGQDLTGFFDEWLYGGNPPEQATTTVP